MLGFIQSTFNSYQVRWSSSDHGDDDDGDIDDDDDDDDIDDDDDDDDKYEHDPDIWLKKWGNI